MTRDERDALRAGVDDTRAELVIGKDILRALLDAADERDGLQKDVATLRNHVERWIKEAREMTAQCDALRAERDALREKWFKVRQFRDEIAPLLCGGTDFWDAHTPREIHDEAMRLRDATIDAITSVVKRERDALRAVAEQAREALRGETYDSPIRHRLLREQALAALDAVLSPASEYGCTGCRSTPCICSTFTSTKE